MQKITTFPLRFKGRKGLVLFGGCGDFIVRGEILPKGFLPFFFWNRSLHDLVVGLSKSGCFGSTQIIRPAVL